MEEKADKDPNIKIELLQKLYCETTADNRPQHFPPLDYVDNQKVFSSFIRLLTDIEMNEDEASYHYSRIIEHSRYLETTMDRKVGFRVAMLDYLLNINPKMKCPKFIEFSDYQNIVSLSFIDNLTGVFNRNYFDNSFNKELHRAKRYQQPFSVVMLDLDDFKQVNDTFGHPVGDSVLKEFAYLLKNLLREEDIAARYGGEEFVVMLPQTDVAGSKIFAERLLQETLSYTFPENIPLSFSAGLATYPIHGDSKKDLIEMADKSLYASKSRGKKCVSVLGQEKRETKRYSSEAPITIISDFGQKEEGRLINISFSGVAGEAGVPLKPGELITLQFALGHEQRCIFDIHAQIIWIQESRFGARYTNDDKGLLHKAVSCYLPSDASSSEKEQQSLF
jgi:diguanylate cyclase (GGDEF)-like protein